MKATQRLLTTLVALGLSAGSVFANLSEEGLMTVYDKTPVFHFDETLASSELSTEYDANFADGITAREMFVSSAVESSLDSHWPPDHHWRFERIRRADVYLSEPQDRRGRVKSMYMEDFSLIAEAPGSAMEMEAVIPEPAVAGWLAGISALGALIFRRFRGNRRHAPTMVRPTFT